jgi:hypothetical protein
MVAGLYDCRSVKIPRAYGELLVADSAASCDTLKGLRNADYQAVTFARFKEAPLTETACEENDEAFVLCMAIAGTAQPGGGSRRYDRVIIVQRGASDDISGLIAFLRQWFPNLVQEKRVFVARVPGKGALNETTASRVLGTCRFVDATDG